MATELTIRDGDPWWLSPDVWTVPGSNPNGSPGSPTAEEPCYMWARVTNAGSTGVKNATVRFYWADPSVGFDRNSANHVGTSYVSLSAGETKEVLCLTPWVPVYVNSGHECILAEAFHEEQDPLPATASFDVPSDRHVAQRNISVLEASESGFFSMLFMVVNPTRLEQTFELVTAAAEAESLEYLQAHFGKTLGTALEGKLEPVDLGLLHRGRRCPGEGDLRSVERRIRVTVPAGHRVPATLLGRLPKGKPGTGALVHVVQMLDEKETGGLSAIVRWPASN